MTDKAPTRPYREIVREIFSIVPTGELEHASSLLGELIQAEVDGIEAALKAYSSYKPGAVVVNADSPVCDHCGHPIQPSEPMAGDYWVHTETNRTYCSALGHALKTFAEKDGRASLPVGAWRRG